MLVADRLKVALLTTIWLCSYAEKTLISQEFGNLFKVSVWLILLKDEQTTVITAMQRWWILSLLVQSEITQNFNII